MFRPHEPSFDCNPVRVLLGLIGVFLWCLPALGVTPPDQMKSQTAPYYVGYCGDLTCGVGEDCSSCPDDCGTCNGFCGDAICQPSEDCSNCSYDCGSCSENRSVVVNGKRYWAEYAANAIWRSNLDGSQVEMVYSVNGPYGIGYDPAAGILIWTSATDETVQAAALGGGGVFTLQSSFDEDSAIAFKATGEAPLAAASATSASAGVAASPTTSLSYSVIDTEVVKLTEDINTGAEQQEVLLTLSYAGEVHGLTLSADGTALYLGDAVGRMSRRLDIASHAVQWLVFEDYSAFDFLTFRSPEEGQ